MIAVPLSEMPMITGFKAYVGYSIPLYKEDLLLYIVGRDIYKYGLYM